MTDREYMRAWREKHRDRLREYNARYWAQNRERYLTKMRAGRSNQRFAEAIHWTVFARIEQLPCFACGVEPARGVDHIVPKARGGRNVISNLQPACFPCNQHKSAN